MIFGAQNGTQNKQKINKNKVQKLTSKKSSSRTVLEPGGRVRPRPAWERKERYFCQGLKKWITFLARHLHKHEQLRLPTSSHFCSFSCFPRISTLLLFLFSSDLYFAPFPVFRGSLLCSFSCSLLVPQRVSSDLYFATFRVFLGVQLDFFSCFPRISTLFLFLIPFGPPMSFLGSLLCYFSCFPRF